MIRFENVTKKYSGTKRPAINEMNLEVARGEFVFLVGASGSGKSTCLRLILKEEKPSKGSIFVLGNDLGSISSRKIPYFRRNLGVVFQDFRLLPNKTVFENVAFTLQVIGKSRGYVQEAVPDVLKMVGLENKADRLPHELSGGEQQRVAIARAVVNKPQILLADEPTGNLDPATSAGIMQILERINAGGTTVLMATHEAGIVDKMQRRVIELVDGIIVRDELEGGYGTTGIVPELKPAVAKGQSAKTAREEVAEAAAQADAETQAHQVLIANPAPRPEPAPTSRRTLPVPTGEVEPLPTGATGAISLPSSGELGDVTDHLSLAERLGLRAADDQPDTDDEQSVGPVR
ncbi:cell division ATP-binding protein FtsE [Mycetocola manganoxydans]|uniref:Cell division ATP-binding protein FtsE n=1 Tax=Mycetocola manganoxydans TaxID=699879 RepID=A0A3L6ZS31_9MICO|nr:cell division ATP-binding protein FtsE [Mycetocola manganoxydans]RLP70743.1 cell division ATP-binding protein FtsE [Mycetocola manganoxydans]GHD48574.1 cell division ATP-binding protein FtsE [Mycetocola manganoxydans]